MSGTLRERPTGSGRWELRAYVGRDSATGNPRQVSRVFRGGKRAAKHALDELVAEVSAGRHVGTAATFGKLLDEWERTLEGQRSANTADTYKNHIRVRIRPNLGTIKLRSLTAADLDAFYAKLAEDGLAVGTIQLNHAIISGALTQAVKWGWLRESPARFASPPRQRQVERTTLTPEQVRELIAAAEEDDPDLAMLIVLGALTGCRRGELIGLKWSDVNWTDRTLRVARSLVPAPGGGHREGPPKGGKARTVAIGEIGVAVLMRYRDAQCAKLGVAPASWLLSYDGQHPLRAGAVSNYITALGKRTSIDVHLHELRHFAASYLAGAGVDVETLRARMGHSSIEVTGGYLHGVSALDHQAADILGAVVSEPQTTESDGSSLTPLTL